MSTQRKNPTVTAFGIAIALILLLWLASSGSSGLLFAIYVMMVVLAFCLFRVLTHYRPEVPQDRLDDLAELHRRGLITDEQFQSELDRRLRKL